MMPKYDGLAYDKVTNLKVDALALMDKGTETYVTHEEEVIKLNLRIEKAYEYAKGKPKNTIITKQWLILKDPEGHMIGGYLKRWKKKEILSQAFITEAKKTIAEGFDQIIGLESGLIKSKEEEN
jgi:hypothetical protein